MKTEKKDGQNPNVIINDLTIISPDRSRKDIQTLKNNIVASESVYYPNRVGLYDLYHDVYTLDGFLNGIVTKRINNVLNKKLKFIDAKGQADDGITKLMASKVGRDLISQILESKFWGISGVEFVVGNTFAFAPIPRKHIKPETGTISRNQYSLTQDSGFDYTKMPFVWVIGDKNDLGLFLPCSMYAIYKRGNFGDWAQYVEIFGQPVRIMYYDAYDTQTKTELKKVLDSSGSSLAMMIPKQAQFEIVDGKTSNGTGELQGSFKDACNSEMAICILGNTETTTSSTSSGYAQSKEHGKQQDEITKSDLAFVTNMLNSDTFLAVLKSYGFMVAGGQFAYELELDLEGLKLRMEIDTFVSAKVPIGDDYFYETYGIPKPKDYAQLKAAMEKAPQPPKGEFKADSSQPNADSPKPNADSSKPKADSSKPKADSSKPKADSPKLIETKKKSLADLFLKNLADFFDHAQR